jgi:hypothetical protein
MPLMARRWPRDPWHPNSYRNVKRRRQARELEAGLNAIFAVAFLLLELAFGLLVLALGLVLWSVRLAWRFLKLPFRLFLGAGRRSSDRRRGKRRPSR